MGYLGNRLMNKIVSEVVSQGTQVVSKAVSQSIHEGFQYANNVADTQRALIGEREKNKLENARNLLLARLAVSYYIARANGELSDEERNELGRLTNEVLRGRITPDERMRAEVRRINTSDDSSFVFVEKYLQPIPQGELVTLLSVAEAVASSDSEITPEEEEAMNKLRDYVSDRTGKDFTANNFDEKDLICQSCGGHMDVSDGGGMLVCPFCGTTRVVNERKLYSELKEYNFGGVSVGDDFFDILEGRLSRGAKIEAIKYVVDKLKLPLADAKGLVEAYENDMDRTKYDAVFRGQGRKIE